MIVAERKPLEEIRRMLGEFQKILVVGCGTCVAVCMSGGEKEVEILAQELRMKSKLEGRNIHLDEVTLTRQCDKEFLKTLAEKINDYDVLLSTACGAGVQFLSEMYEEKVVLPALNTRFIGTAEGTGVWNQRCLACSDCILDRTGGVCPVTMCAKGLLNGPCGGTHHGKCEVDDTRDCAWTLIYNRLVKLDRLYHLKRIQPPKNFKIQIHPARYIHIAYQNEEDSGHE